MAPFSLCTGSPESARQFCSSTWSNRGRAIFSFVRTVGVEGEIELPTTRRSSNSVRRFSSSSSVCPDPQRDALGVAFGLSPGQAPSPFLVGLAVLGLLSDAAEHQPLLCVVDDAQWLDGASARALAFVARRLLAERIALVFATREVTGRSDPLPAAPRRSRWVAAMPGPCSSPSSRRRLDEAVLERIIAETGGNPLAILELPRGLTPAQLAGGFGLPAALPLSTGIEQSFARRLARLPRDARRLLLLAAAEPVGDPALLWRAAQQLGIPETAAQTVESEGLLTVDGAGWCSAIRSCARRCTGRPSRTSGARLTARSRTQPIRRSTRIGAHGIGTGGLRPRRRAGRRARASAARAQARGGFAAAAAFLERSAVLTPAPVRRAQRALVAAQTKFRAGALDEALGLLASTEVGALDELDRARVELLRAQIAFVFDARQRCAAMLLAAAERLESALRRPSLVRRTSRR